MCLILAALSSNQIVKIYILQLSTQLLQTQQLYKIHTIKILAGAGKNNTFVKFAVHTDTPSHSCPLFLLQDVCISCGLVATAAITFVIMFLPKGRQLSAMGRDGVYAEDRTDVYTGSSSTQSTGKITLFRGIISYILESINI